MHLCCSHMSRVVRKLAFCICENKDADQLRGNRKADQRLCFPYTDSTTPLLPKDETDLDKSNRLLSGSQFVNSLYCIVFIVLYCIVLYCIVLYCIVLYCIV